MYEPGSTSDWERMGSFAQRAPPRTTTPKHRYPLGSCEAFVSFWARAALLAQAGVAFPAHALGLAEQGVDFARHSEWTDRS